MSWGLALIAAAGAVEAPPVVVARLPPTTERGLKVVRRIEQRLGQEEQLRVKTWHVLHGGVYSRTMRMLADTAITGALVKVPTTLVVSGWCTVLVGEAEEHTLLGYHVFAASAGRKQAFIAHGDTSITMMFRTDAKSVEEAEREFTDEHDRLLSRVGDNEITITGE